MGQKLHLYGPFVVTFIYWTLVVEWYMAVFVVKNERQQTHVTMRLVVCSNYSRNHSKFISKHLGDNSLVGICAMNHMWSRGILKGLWSHTHVHGIFPISDEYSWNLPHIFKTNFSTLYLCPLFDRFYSTLHFRIILRTWFLISYKEGLRPERTQLGLGFMWFSEEK